MDKQQLLDLIQSRLASGELKAAELHTLLNSNGENGRVTTSQNLSENPSALSTVLYFIGGGVVFLGLAFLIAQQWSEFSSTMKIFVTFGSGLAAFVVGVLLSHQQRLGAAGPAFFLISALLLPAGLFVSFDEFGIRVNEINIQIQIAALLFATYTAAYWLMRKNVLLVFSLLFGSWLFFAVMQFLIDQVPIFDNWRFFSYSMALLGLSQMLLAYSFSDTQRQPLSGWLYSTGAILFFSATLALGGWKPAQNSLWEVLYPGLVFVGLFLSTYVRSKSLLIFSSLALGCYLIKITAEYFSDSLGWAFSLVLLGFMLMAVAYLAVLINRRYVATI